MSKVLCPGEMLIDLFCTNKGVSLEEGINFLKKAGGASANVAIAIQKLGAEGVFLGAVGNDPFGTFLKKTLEKYNAPTNGLVKVDNSTTIAYVSLKEDGERDFHFQEGATAMYSFDMIDQSILDNTSILHFGSALAFLGGELGKTYDKLLEYAIDNDIIISFDPNYRDALFNERQEEFILKSKKYISKSHVVKVSDEEAELITGCKDYKEAARQLVDLGAKQVLVTLGKDGCLLVSESTEQHIPVIPVQMVDATGAGDSFIGAILAKLAHSKKLDFESMKSYVEFGNKVGSITVQKYGALDSIPTLEELQNMQ